MTKGHTTGVQVHRCECLFWRARRVFIAAVVCVRCRQAVLMAALAVQQAAEDAETGTRTAHNACTCVFQCSLAMKHFTPS